MPGVRGDSSACVSPRPGYSHQVVDLSSRLPKLYHSLLCWGVPSVARQVFRAVGVNKGKSRAEAAETAAKALAATQLPLVVGHLAVTAWGALSLLQRAHSFPSVCSARVNVLCAAQKPRTRV